uniref:Uncharacterized protein n=1 Tax=Tuber indicum TaxID=55307 RepID=W0C474_9PEZI|nr:hypothetical protein [Tuber indicum]
MSQYTINSNNNCFNNTSSFSNVWNNFTVADDRSQLLAWLSPLEPRLRHRDIQEHRVDNVGEWLIQTDEFRSWYDWSLEGEGNKAVLFCHGDPGVGKTFIRLCDQARGQNTTVTCFYFDFAARKEQSATNMLGSLLKQIVSGMERIPEEISRAFQEQRRAIGGRGPQLPDIVKMLQTITSSQRTFMCIDALDECAAVHRAKLLDSLKKILGKSPGIRIFLTGSVSIGPRRDDIIRYLRVRLDEDETPDAMDEGLEADVLEQIPGKISEMFILVSLNIEAILQESTTYRRRERLSKMTDGLGLGDAYGATIGRIKAQGGDKSRLGMAALMWISHAQRPLRTDELCCALAVELGSTDFNANNIPSMSTLIGCCQGLITVGKEASAVRLVHFTLQEYLSAHPDIFSRPHAAMAEICLTYLNSQQVKDLSTDPSPDTSDAPFLEYCSMYWGVHAKTELSDCGRSLALKLFQGFDGHISTEFLLAQVGNLGPGGHDTWPPFSGLHCASFFGIVEVVAALIEMGCWDINEGDCWGYTPLAWAAHNGHEEVVKMLLGLEQVDPGEPDNRGQTPLSHATACGHEEVVKILLGREEVNPDKPDNDGQTPLSLAAWFGHEEVVRILLGREDVNPNEPDNDGQTPLSNAAWRGYEGVAKLLLEREEVNPDKPDNLGRTPLSHAAGYGHEGVVKIFLGREEVNPDKPDIYCRTPLSHAVWSGYEEVVRMLLMREEVNPDKSDSHGQSPLSHAAAHGLEEVVKILLMREEVNPDRPDDCGQTPLSLAAWGGHAEVVKVLLGREDVSPDRPNNDGQTPLSFASRHGHQKVVALLQSHKALTPSAI